MRKPHGIKDKGEGKMKHIRAWMTAFFLTLCMLVGFQSSLILSAASLDNSAGMDIVIVIDTSGSMKSTDANGVTLEAAKLFIDMMECSGSRVGLVSFSNTLGTVYPLTEINQTSDKDAIKSAIDALTYTGDTDIGQAAQKAVELLNLATDVGNKKGILFFTDGEIDLDNNSKVESQAEQDSRTNAENATATAASSQIPIYTIGLNANGNVDTELIQKMSLDTAGKNYIVSTADELPNIFNEIFADFVESTIVNVGDITIADANQYESIGFNIPNDSVLEANIVLLSDNGRLTDVALTDPSGNMFGPDGTQAVLSSSGKYNMLKLFTPASGDWTLSIKGDQGCQVHVNLLFNYKVVYKAEATDSDNGVILTAYFEDKGVALTDDALYQQFTSVARVQREDGTRTEYPMTYANGIFTSSEIPIDRGETITMTAYAQSDTMYRESDPITCSGGEIIPTEIMTTSLPSPIELSGLIASLTKTDINLSAYFTTSDGTPLTFQVQSKDEAVVKAETEESTLKLKGAGKGTSEVVIAATDQNGNTATQMVEVNVTAKLNNLIPVIIAGVVVLLLLLLLIILIVRIASAPKLDGYLYWFIDDERNFGSNSAEEYNLAFEKKQAVVANIVTEPSVAFIDLNKVVIKPAKNGIVVNNGSKDCTVMDGFGAESKKLVVRDNGTFEIICRVDDGEVKISCSYSIQPQDDFY
jgi:Mg-chelatase subunit ChlD